MNVTIFGAGSLGDIQPCLRLGQKLQQAGFHITLAAPQNFASIIQGQQVTFHPLRGDMQKIMAGDTGRRFMERGGTNPFYSIFAMRKMLGPIAIQMAEEALAACQNADALITLAVFAPFGKTIAEIRRIPLLLVEPTPVLPTRNFPAPGFPIQRNLGGALNRLTGFAMLGVIWQWYRPFVNKFRKHFGLRRLSGSGFHRILISTPLLSAYSPSVIPQPQDWSPNVHITGYWFQDSQTTWKPSARLLNFLEQGEPPVYVGFGSMTGHDPESITKMALAALTESGRRGVIATGWGGIKTTNIPKNILALDAAPHDWLFPRMAAVVHHGGAGTTAEGLRAGVPTVTVPFIVDQLFWGTRVHSMGAGTKPIQAHGLTGRNLAEAIQRAGTDPLIRHRAESIGERIRSEDGIGAAVKIVREYLGA